MCKVMHLICFLILFAHPSETLANASANANDNTAQAIIRQEAIIVKQDIIAPFETSQNKLCVDGTSANGKEIIDYWVDLECSFCRIDDVLLAQRTIPNICIVVRHSPSIGEDSIKKALAYEALRKESVNEANIFWSNNLSEGSVSIPYTQQLMNSLQSLMLSVEKFNNIIDEIRPIVDEDIIFSQGKITYTPTFVIQGFRFPACDFSPEQLSKVITIAKSARQGREDAINEIITIISNGINNKPML